MPLQSMIKDRVTEIRVGKGTKYALGVEREEYVNCLTHSLDDGGCENSSDRLFPAMSAF